MNVLSDRGVAHSKNFSTLPADVAGIHRYAEAGFGTSIKADLMAEGEVQERTL